MATRYAYWRSASGRAGKGDSAKYAPTPILAQLGKISEPAGKDSIHWSDFTFHRLETALLSAWVVLYPSGEELNENDAASILRGAIADTIRGTGGATPLSEALVLKNADARAAAFFRRPTTRFVLVASLSIDRLPFKSARIGDCLLQPLRSRDHFPPPQRAYSDPQIATHLNSSHYALVRVSVPGRSTHEASERAIFAIDLLRALWSIRTTSRWSISFGVRKKPIGMVHSGPVYTLHCDPRDPIDTFWLDRHRQPDRDLFVPKADIWPALERSRKWLLRRLATHKFRSDLEPLLVRYVQALDQPDFDSAFLKMWSILEQLTDTVGRYEETARRAASPFDDHELVRSILECLRSRRNLYVHSAAEKADTDQAVYIVKNFVEVHLLSAIRNSFEITRLEDYAKELARGRNVEVLRRERQALSRAIRAIERRGSS